MLTSKDLELLKVLLLNLQAQLRGDVENLSDGALDGAHDSKSPTHMAELGTETYEQEFSLRLMETDQFTLDEIKLALKRIDAGTYGLCEDCLEEGKPPVKCAIPKTRLKERPFTRTCVDCARKRENSFSPHVASGR